ncbi:hypothetical protein O999_11295 [Pseudomonas putida LF54]|nr:hypothetical protein O999_11295 [Pseudomonas putida LF54]
MLMLSCAGLRVAGWDARAVFIVIRHIGVGIRIVCPIVASIRLQLRPIIFNIAAAHSQ